MNNKTNATLNIIYDNLPFFSEEGSEYTSVSMSDLLLKCSERNYASFVGELEIIQRLFLSIGLLDAGDLEKGEWRFVSRPASLLARSLILVLKNSDNSLFPEGFWLTHDSTSPWSDEQRKILHEIEARRRERHGDKAKPIRFIHVAWGLISIGKNVLLRHREDKDRLGLSNYVLIGGRLNQSDLRAAGESMPLRILQSESASNNKKAIENALTREMAEETGLACDDYCFNVWRSLKPYTKIEGAGANHALTEYRITIFHIDLTESGYLKLIKRVANDDALVWFSQKEFIDAKSTDGKGAFIDALLSDFDTEKEWWVAVENLRPSYHLENTYKGPPFTLPFLEDKSFSIGNTGKEKSVSINVSDDEILMLNSLALPLKGERPEAVEEGVTLLGDGWFEIERPELRARISGLARRLTDINLPIIDIKNQQLFRMSCSADYMYFSDSLFRYELSESALSLIRSRLETPLATFAERKSNPIDLSVNLKAELERLSRGEDIRRYSPEDLKKILRREIRPVCLQLGLRSLVRVKSGDFRLCVERAS